MKSETTQAASRCTEQRVVMPLFAWCPQYCSCTYEGGIEDLALCRTRKKAREVLAAHKHEVQRLWTDDGLKYPRKAWEVWRIVKREII